MDTTKQPIGTAPGITPAPVAPMPTVEQLAHEERPARTATKPRWQPSSLYDKLGMTLAYGGALAFAAVLWLAGGFFTLTAFGITVGMGAALAWWLLPAAITGIEIWLMPRTGMAGRLVALFGLVLAVDVASSWYGVIEWAGGRFVKFGPGFTIPEGGPILHTLAVAAGLVLAFYPEKLGRKAWAELLKVWR